MNLRQYNVSELRRIISESSQEFKPKLGDNVEKDNKKINDEAYKSIAKETEAYDGGVRKNKKEKIQYPNSDNKGMQDLKYDVISDDFKERVKSQMKGYTSADEEKKHKNDPFGNAEFKDVDGLEGRHKEMKRNEVDLKTSGIVGKELDRRAVSGVSGSRVYENKLTKIRFKNTIFVTESHMMSRIPDDYKVNGKRFIMEDKNGKEYLVEWHNEEPKVLNTTKVNEQQARIKELFGYKSNGASVNGGVNRLDEDHRIDDMLGKVRKLMK